MRHLTRYSLFLLLFISCTGYCFAQAPKTSTNKPDPPLSSPDEYIERGTALWHKADYEGAILNFSKAIELDEASFGSDTVQAERLVATYFKRATLLSEIRRSYDDAIADINRVIQIRPQWGEAYEKRGQVYMAASDLSNAIADYTRAIEINPKFADAYFYRAIARNGLRDYAGEMEDLNTCIEIDPNDYRAYFYRGVARNNRRDFKGALADYDKGIELKPDSPTSYELRGELLLYLGRDTEAEQDFNKCFVLDPSQRPRIEQRVKEMKRLRNLSR
jgi:tetratricopeptide (TPR) repeat protein